MPPLERMDLLDTAIFWHKKAVDGYAEPVLGSPIEIPCRWTDRQAVSMDPQGNTQTVDATVVVDDDIEQFAVQGEPVEAKIIGGLMWHGDIQQLLDVAYLPTYGLMEIKTYKRAPDIKLREYRRVAGLSRFNDTLPQVVP